MRAIRHGIFCGGSLLFIMCNSHLFIGVITGRHVTRQVTYLPVHDDLLTDSPSLFMTIY